MSEKELSCEVINDILQGTNNNYVKENLTVTEDNTGAFVISDVQTEEEYIIKNLEDIKEVLEQYNVEINFSMHNFGITDYFGDKFNTTASLKRGMIRVNTAKKIEPVVVLLNDALEVLNGKDMSIATDEFGLKKLIKQLQTVSNGFQSAITKLTKNKAADNWIKFMGESPNLQDNSDRDFQKKLATLVKSWNDKIDADRKVYNDKINEEIGKLKESKPNLINDASNKDPDEKKDNNKNNKNNSENNSNQAKAIKWVHDNAGKYNLQKNMKGPIIQELKALNENAKYDDLKNAIEKGADKVQGSWKKDDFVKAAKSAQFSEKLSIFDTVMSQFNFAEGDDKSAINSQLKIVQDTEFGVCGEDKFGSLWDLNTGKCLFKSDQGSISEEDVKDGEKSEILDEDDEWSEDEDFGDDFDEDSEDEDWDEESDDDEEWSDEEEEDSDDEDSDDFDEDEDDEDLDFSEKQFSEDDDDDFDEDLEEEESDDNESEDEDFEEDDNESEEDSDEDDDEFEEEDLDNDESFEESQSDSEEIEEESQSPTEKALDSAMATIDKMADKLVKIAQNK